MLILFSALLLVQAAMSSADDQRWVGKKSARKDSHGKTRISERGDVKQPRDDPNFVGAELWAACQEDAIPRLDQPVLAGFPRPSSPTSTLHDDQAATDSDSDGEAVSMSPILEISERVSLFVDVLRECSEGRDLSRPDMLHDFSRWFEALEAQEGSPPRNDAADAYLSKAKACFSEMGFGTMYQDPGQMLRLRGTTRTLNFDSWPRSNNHGVVGSADDLEALPPSDSDSMARDLGNGQRTDCQSLQWHKCLGATVQGVTMNAGDPELVRRQRVLDACPGHTTVLGEKEELVKTGGSLAEPDGLKEKIAAFAPYTFGACLEQRGSEFFTRDDVLVVRACGAEVTKAAKTFFELAGYRFLPLSDHVYNQFGLNANCARPVVGAKNPAPWGAHVAYKPGTMPLLVQCLPQAGSCAAGPNARFWGGATGIGLIYLTAANLERALAGKANIAFEDSLFRVLGFSPEKAHARVERVSDGVLPWVSPCVLGGHISGGLLREAWIAYDEGTATDDQKMRVEANREGLANASSSMREARAAVVAGKATEKQKQAVQGQNAGLAKSLATRKANAAKRRSARARETSAPNAPETLEAPAPPAGALQSDASLASEALEAPASAAAPASRRAAPDIDNMSIDAMRKELRAMNDRGFSKLNKEQLRKRIKDVRADVAETRPITGFFGKASKSGSGSG